MRCRFSKLHFVLVIWNSSRRLWYGARFVAMQDGIALIVEFSGETTVKCGMRSKRKLSSRSVPRLRSFKLRAPMQRKRHFCLHSSSWVMKEKTDLCSSNKSQCTNQEPLHLFVHLTSSQVPAVFHPTNSSVLCTFLSFYFSYFSNRLCPNINCSLVAFVVDIFELAMLCIIVADLT